MAIVRLLSDPRALATARAAADALGRTLIWPRAAARFAEVFLAAATQPPSHQPAGAAAGIALRLDHLDRLTDTTGIVQFSVGTRPDPRSGYCVDDVARLAIVASGLARIMPDGDRRPHRWLATALRMLDLAVCVDGAHNVLGPDGTWQDGPSVADHVGRAIWALGVVSSLPDDTGTRAAGLLETMLPWLAGVSAPRTLAYAILGLTRAPVTEARRSMISNLADRVEAASRRVPAGPWYEQCLTYDNARLPEAVLAAGLACADRGRIDRALSSLDWYARQVGLAPQGTGYLRCVGNRWRDARADGPTAGEGDEQPIDAAATVEALVGAWRATADRTYAELAQRAFAWFHGANRAGVCVYDPTTGGCRDGLSAVGASENEGAESTLAYHQALLTMHAAGLVSLSGRGDLPAQLAVPDQNFGGTPPRRPTVPRPSQAPHRVATCRSRQPSDPASRSCWLVVEHRAGPGWQRHRRSTHPLWTTQMSPPSISRIRLIDSVTDRQRRGRSDRVSHRALPPV